jgi:WD40 repeat protein
LNVLTVTRVLANPFPGLRPFMHEEADLFFGRDRQSDELVRRLARKRFLAVLGTSGSGKSSLVRAGLLPSLEGGFMAEAGAHWLTAILRPQDDPIGFLARALVEAGVLTQLDVSEAAAEEVVETTLWRSSLGVVEVARLGRLEPHENLLILVDQFEEIFRFADLAKQRGTEDEAKAFVKLLLVASQQTEVPVYVVITMRSDFLGDCDRFPGLPETITDSPYLIPRLTRDELQAAITGPVGVRGGRIAASVVQRLLNDVGDDPDQLPILQHALMRAWDHWQHDDPEERPIDLSDLEAIGGMAEALSRHAEEAYASLTSDRETMIAERLFKCLTEKGPDNRELRRPTPLWRIAAIASADLAEVVRVIDVFRAPGRSFLMPPHGVELEAESVVDISHESLIRHWWRLRRWVEEEAESVNQYRRLAESAELHARGAAGLVSEPELSITLAWRDREMPNAAWAERYDPELDRTLAFLEMSERARDEEEIRRRRARRRKFLIPIVAASAIAAILAAFSVFALSQRNAAVRSRDSATSLALASAANGQLAAHPEVSLLLALDAYRASPGTQATSSMISALENTRRSGPEAILRGHTNPLSSIAFSPNGRVLATADSGGGVRLWDPRSRRQLGAPLPGLTGRISSLAFSRDGRTLATALENGTTRLWDVRSHDPVGQPLRAHADSDLLADSNVVAFDPGGRALAAATDEGATRLWDVQTHDLLARPVRPPPDFALDLMAAAFSPNGRRLVTGDFGGLVRVWDVLAGKEIARWGAAPEASISSLAVSPGGRTLALGNVYGTVRLWSIRRREQLGRPLRGNSRAVTSIAFSPDGRTLATGSADTTARLWDVRTQAPRGEPLRGHTAAVLRVTFSPDGRTLATAGADRTVRLWDVRGHRQLGQSLPGRVGDETAQFSNAVAFSPDGRMLAAASSDRSVRVWDVHAHAQLGGPLSRAPVLAPNICRTTRLHGGTQQVCVDRPVAPLPEGERWLVAVAFSADGTTLATAGVDGLVRRWSLRTHAQLGRPLRTTSQPAAFAFSRDGHELAVAGSSNAVWLLDVKGRRPLVRLRGRTGAVALAFSPDGRTLATGGADAAVHLWDVGRRTELSAPLHGHTGAVSSVAFSPDGRTLASASTDATVRLWDVPTRTQVGQPLRGHADAVLSVAFSPDGRTLASASADETVRLWDVRTHTQLGRPLKGHTGTIWSVAFSPDGRALATAGSDQTVRLWQGILWRGRRDLTEQVCRLVRGDLTPAEWDVLAPDLPYRTTCPT